MPTGGKIGREKGEMEIRESVEKVWVDTVKKVDGGTYVGRMIKREIEENTKMEWSKNRLVWKSMDKKGK